MIAILEKSKHNVDFYHIVDFVGASHIRYALTINPTIYVSHIRQFWSTARIKTTNEGTKILATVDGRTVPLFATMLVTQGEGSGTLTEPHHTPSLQASQSSHHDLSSPSHPTATTKTIPTTSPIEIPTLRQYSRRATWIAQSKALPTAADEPASLLRDDSQREAFPTVSSLDAGQDRENLIKNSALPYDLTPRDLEISSLKARIKLLEDKDKGSAELSGDDALIKGRSMEIGEEVGVEKSTKRGTVSVPLVVEVSTIGVPTVSGLLPTVSAIFTTASVVTPYSRRPREISAKVKGKEKMVESDTPKKKKIQEQINVQVAREMEEEMAKEDQRMNEQIARDAKIARIHAEEELKIMIDGFDISTEMIAKHLHEYEQAAADLTIGENIELINELVKYQDHHVKILKYQAQQSKPLSKKEQREFYMSLLRSHAGWKTKHFREERERVKRKGLKLEQGSAKKIKTSEEVSKEDLKEMKQLVPVEEVYVEALQVKHPIIDWEIHSKGKKDY
nr:hypothetical protein [Tanacetum cinerariifolium]